MIFYKLKREGNEYSTTDNHYNNWYHNFFGNFDLDQTIPQYKLVADGPDKSYLYTIKNNEWQVSFRSFSNQHLEDMINQQLEKYYERYLYEGKCEEDRLENFMIEVSLYGVKLKEFLFEVKINKLINAEFIKMGASKDEYGRPTYQAKTEEEIRGNVAQ